MQVTVNVTKNELAELLEKTKQKDPGKAVRIAIREHLRYLGRMELIEMAGTIDIDPDWIKQIDEAELRGHNAKPGAGSH